MSISTVLKVLHRKYFIHTPTSVCRFVIKLFVFSCTIKRNQSQNIHIRNHIQQPLQVFKIQYLRKLSL